MSVPNLSAAEVLFDRAGPAGESGGSESLPRPAIPRGEDWRIRLLERSSTLRERLGDDFEPIRGAAPDFHVVARRLARWRTLAAKGSEAGFATLLGVRGLDPVMLEQRLQPLRWRARKPLPDWLATLERVVEEAQRVEAAPVASDPDSPWKAFMLPFVSVFRAGLARNCDRQGSALSDAARSSGERALTRGLGMLFAAPLAAAWADFKAQTGGERLADEALRVQFLRRLRLPARLREFLVEYSVAARGAARLIAQSQHNLVEMLERLQHDRAEIGRTFSPQVDPGEVVGLDCGLSDPHRGGRSVMRLSLASGLRLIYKPRPVSLDLAYGALLTWLRAHGLAHSLRTPTYLARPEHAWVEHIDPVACTSQVELECFCRNAGVLLALAYLLDATDLHDGNLIAAGISPLIIDLETLLQPRLREPHAAQPQDALREVARLIDHSVMRSGLLPFLRAGSDGSLADVGCLGSLFDCQAAHWYSPAAEASPLAPGAKAVDAIALAAAVERGFTDTYRFLIAQRVVLAGPGGPLQAFARQPLRFVFRDTNLYIKLLAPSLGAAALREGVDRSIELEALYRALLSRDATSALSAAIDVEVEALEALDIPLLGADADDDALVTQSGARVAGLFQRPGFEALHHRLALLDEQDLGFQRKLISLAFQARAAGNGTDHGSASQAPAGDLAQIAGRLLEDLDDSRITGEDGSVSWLAPVPVANDGHWSIGPLPLDLPSGNLGVALFAAASARLCGGERGFRLARSATALVLRRLQLVPGTAATHFARHGDSLYALARIADLLDDDTLRAQAQALAGAQSGPAAATQAVAGRERDTCERVFGLLALGRVDAALQLATALLTQWQRTSTIERRGLLCKVPRLPQCFARVGHLTGDEGLCGAADDVLHLLGEAAECDSASLAMLPAALVGCIGAIAADQLREPVVRALAAFDAAPLPLLDSGEAGVCGQIELLLSAGLALDEPVLGERARSLAARMTARAAARGGFTLVPGMPPGTLLPGFERGIAGIGYTLLRLQPDAALPSVLLRE